MYSFEQVLKAGLALLGDELDLNGLLFLVSAGVSIIGVILMSGGVLFCRSLLPRSFILFSAFLSTFSSFGSLFAWGSCLLLINWRNFLRVRSRLRLFFLFVFLSVDDFRFLNNFLAFILIFFLIELLFFVSLISIRV